MEIPDDLIAYVGAGEPGEARIVANFARVAGAQTGEDVAVILANAVAIVDWKRAFDLAIQAAEAAGDRHVVAEMQQTARALAAALAKKPTIEAAGRREVQ